jgi:hypothetical protein
MIGYLLQKSVVKLYIVLLIIAAFLRRLPCSLLRFVTATS